MQPPVKFLSSVLLLVVSSTSQWAQDATGVSNCAVNDVIWTTPGKNENDSMPIGNGDVAANVWTEQNGDLVLLVAKADAWTDLGKLVKLGRVRMKLSPNLFGSEAGFQQKLALEKGAIEIKSGANTVQVWIDANHPVIHVETHLARPGTLQASLELWRTTTRPFNNPSPERGGLFEFGGHLLSINFEPDTVFPAQPDRLGVQGNSVGVFAASRVVLG